VRAEDLFAAFFGGGMAQDLDDEEQVTTRATSRWSISLAECAVPETRVLNSLCGNPSITKEG